LAQLFVDYAHKVAKPVAHSSRPANVAFWPEAEVAERAYYFGFLGSTGRVGQRSEWLSLTPLRSWPVAQQRAAVHHFGSDNFCRKRPAGHQDQECAATIRAVLLLTGVWEGSRSGLIDGRE